MSDLDYSVGLDGSAFSRGSRSIERDSTRLRSKLSTDFKTAGNAALGFARSFSAIPILIGGPLGAVAVVAAAAGTAIKTVTDRVKEMQAQSQTAGVNFEAFQELKFYADQNLVSVDALTDGLKEMQLRIDEALVAGTGTGVESLQRLGFTADELREKLKDPPKLFEEIIDRVKQLDDAAQVRILDELFGGTAGEQFLRLMQDGQGAISAARQETRELGIVLEEDYLRTVEDINRQWNTMASIIGNSVKRQVLDLTERLFVVVDRFREIDKRASNTLSKNLLDSTLRIKEIDEDIVRLRKERESITGVLAQAERRNLDGTIASLEAERERLTVAQGLIAAEQNRRNGPDLDPPSQLTFTPTTADTFGGAVADRAGGGGGGGSRARAISETERQAKAIADLRAELAFEAEQLERTALQQEIYTRLKSVGVDASSKMGQVIAAEVTQLHLKREALEQVKKAEEDARQAQQYLFDSLEQGLMAIIEGGENAEKAILKLIVQLGIAFLRAQLLGTGPLAGLFGGGGSPLVTAAIGAGVGGLFADGAAFRNGRVTPFANGGIVHKPTYFPMAGGTGLMGEAGPEAIMPLKRLSGGRLGVAAEGSGGVSVAMPITIDARGAVAGVGEEIRHALETVDIRGRVVEAINEARRRGEV